MNYVLDHREIVIDGFAGAGGASLGIKKALGRSADESLNHCPTAVAIYKANFPDSNVRCQNILHANPRDVARGRPCGLAHFSPDCTGHSKAAGCKPRSKRVRALCWVTLEYAQKISPRLITLENVEEFQDYGPLYVMSQGNIVCPECGKEAPKHKSNKSQLDRPCKPCKGIYFQLFVDGLRKCSYKVEWREIRADRHGTPTIRKRLFLIARRDGRPIVWPDSTHGSGLLPVRTAAECIDWSIPCRSIFDPTRKKPIADATCRRIACGVVRHVLRAKRPFIVPITHRGGVRVHSIDDPLKTVTTAHRGEFQVCSAVLAPRYGEREGQEPRSHAIDEPMPTIVPDNNSGRMVVASLIKLQNNATPRPMDEPLHTILASGEHHMKVMAFLAQHNRGNIGRDADVPLSTITTTGSQQQVVTASHLMVTRQNDSGHDMREPMNTITGSNHMGQVQAFLMKYNRKAPGQSLDSPLHTITTKDRYSLIMTEDLQHILVDIATRMLTPRELFRAQGFPDSFIIDVMVDGKPISKTAQIKAVGNSVCPQVMEAIVRANYIPDQPSLKAPRMRRESIRQGVLV